MALNSLSSSSRSNKSDLLFLLNWCQKLEPKNDKSLFILKASGYILLQDM